MSPVPQDIQHVTSTHTTDTEKQPQAVHEQTSMTTFQGNLTAADGISNIYSDANAHVTEVCPSDALSATLTRKSHPQVTGPQEPVLD